MNKSKKKMKLLSFVLCFFMFLGCFMNMETRASADTLLDDATAKVVTAETTKNQDDVNTAQTAVDLLPDSTDKNSLQSRINTVQSDIDAGTLAGANLTTATNAVTKAETTNLQSDVDDARALVDALPDGADKTALTNRLDVVDSALQYQQDLTEATNAVVTAETTKSQTDVTSATILVNNLPNGTDKTNLLNRLANIVVVTSGKITVEYVDESNNKIASDNVTTNLTFKDYTLNSITISGYDLNDTTSKTVTLTSINNDILVTFHYKEVVVPTSGKITVEYVDELNNKIATDNVMNSLTFKDYTLNAITITGYDLNDTASKTVSLTAINNNLTVTFHYKQTPTTPTTPTSGKITVEYVDESNNKIATDNVTNSLTFKSYTLNTITITGYDLNDTASKTVSLTAVNNDIAVVFHYKKVVATTTGSAVTTGSAITTTTSHHHHHKTVKGSIIIQYIDSDKKKILEDVVMDDLSLDEFKLTYVIIEGYDLNDIPEKDITLTSDNKDIIVTFNYKKLVSCWKQLSDGSWIFYDLNGKRVISNWINLGGIWYYLKADSIMATGWQQISNKWYYFQQSGAMKSGWIQDKGTWYYLNSDGSMATGWINCNEKWYYLNNNGSMAINTFIGDYQLGNDGAWIQ